jgi:hypothetical protein
MAKSLKKNKKSKCGGKSQKLWKMKGCSKSKLRKQRRTRKQMQRGGGCGCGAPFLNGGSKTKGKKMQMEGYQMGGYQMGGNQMGGSGLPPLPATHIGTAWGSNVGDWPGVNGPQGGSWLSQNNYTVDPQTSGTINERTIQFTQGKPDITLIGGSKKNMKFGLGSVYNTLNGYQNPVNPAPYVQPNMGHMTLSEFIR